MSRKLCNVGLVLLLALSAGEPAHGRPKIALTLVSLEAVSRESQETPDNFNGWRQQPGKLLRLTFSASQKLRKLTSARGLNVFFDAWRCSNRKDELDYLSLVYDARGVLGVTQSDDAEGSHQVWVFVAQQHDRLSSSTTEATNPGYDLLSEPFDVCIEIKGRNMALQGFDTEVVRISASQIAKALTENH